MKATVRIQVRKDDLDFGVAFIRFILPAGDRHVTKTAEHRRRLRYV